MRPVLRTLLALGLVIGGCEPPKGAETAPSAQSCPPGLTLADGVCSKPQMAAPAGSSGFAPMPARAEGGAKGKERPPVPVQARGSSGASLGGLVGSWHGVDSDGSATLALEIFANGFFRQEITTLDTSSGRPPGACVQAGRAELNEGSLSFFFDENSCNESFVGQSDTHPVSDQRRDWFVLEMVSYRIEYTRLR